MKIKYSNKVKEQLSTTLLQELVQLSYTTIPYQPVHIFSFKKIHAYEICITHQIPAINVEKKVYLSYRELPNEDIFLFRCNKNIYLLTQSEYIT